MLSSACPHLTTLQLAVARGELEKPYRHNAHAELIRRKGEEHEAAYLASLGDGRRSHRQALGDRLGRRGRDTEHAMRDGAPVVYQATFVDGDWRGLADFVVRQPDGTYEALDTKLARHARPAHIIQLCFYTEQIARIQGSMPRAMHVVTGAGETETFDPNDYLAFYRRLRARFLEASRRRAHLPVPGRALRALRLPRALQGAMGARRPPDARRRDLADAGRAAYRGRDHDARAARRPRPGTRVKRCARRRSPACASRPSSSSTGAATASTASSTCRSRTSAASRSCPSRTTGDIWLDLEGHPWYEAARGLEYLFGWVYLEDGEPRYDCIWAGDRAGEKAGFERLVDLIVERRRRFPGMHVYHYASYERSALTRLMGEHGTRENEIDDLLRGEVLVDLYRVVRQSLRASIPSYSIKVVEELYGFERTAEVSGGSESVVNFEEWLETGEQELLDEIRDYNEEDCRSLYELHRLASRAAAGDIALARAARGARGQGGDRGEARRARARPRSTARGQRVGAAPRPAPRIPPPRGEAAVVGLLQQPDARRGGADRELGDDRRPRARRRARAGQEIPRVHDAVPAAGAQDRRRRRRSCDRAQTTTCGSTTSAVSSRSARRRERGRAAAEGVDPGGAAPYRRAARRGAPLREGPGALPGARRDPRAAAAGALRLRPGPARIGQDVHRRPPGGRADEGRGSASASPRSATRRSTSS